MIIDYLNDRITITLEEFIATFLKKWKMIVLVSIVCASVFAGVSYSFGEEISAPASEEYLFWEDNLENVTNYRENSILMQSDPMEIYQETIFLENISDREKLKNLVISSEVWENLETDRNKMYANELVQWNESETSNNIEIVLRHVTDKECKTWMSYLKEQIIRFDSDVLIIDGASSVVTDEKILELQQKKYIDIEFAKQLLDESQAAYTIEVSIELAAFIGMLMGILFSGVVIVVGLMLKKK